MCAISYTILVHMLTRHQQDNPALAAAIGADRKDWLSLALYLLGIGMAFVHPWLGFGVYFAVAAIWFLPDRRIENRLMHH